MPAQPTFKNDYDRRLSRAEAAVHGGRLTAPAAARFYEIDLNDLLHRLYFQGHGG